MKKSLDALNSPIVPSQVHAQYINLESVIIIDCNEIDNFICSETLKQHGITDVICFTNPRNAIAYLWETKNFYQLIVVEIYMPMINGFDFINEFMELKLNDNHGQICFVSASVDPRHKLKADQLNIAIIDKPFTIEKVLTEINLMRKSILSRIIDKGGMMAFVARSHFDNYELGNKFIMECSEQCDTTLAMEDWGKELINDILHYSETFFKKNIL